jgi:hypothetical protein
MRTGQGQPRSRFDIIGTRKEAIVRDSKSIVPADGYEVLFEMFAGIFFGDVFGQLPFLAQRLKGEPHHKVRLTQQWKMFLAMRV